MIALLYFAAKRGVLKFEPAGIWLAIGFALLYLAIPSTLLGTFVVDLHVIGYVSPVEFERKLGLA